MQPWAEAEFLSFQFLLSPQNFKKNKKTKKTIGSVLIRAQTQGKVFLYPRLIS